MNDIVLLLQQSPMYLALVLSLFGACIGSFINVIAYRLPVLLDHQWRSQCLEILDQSSETENLEATPPNLLRPGSRCRECLSPLKPQHNIPVLGFIFLQGKCAFCKKSISVRYPIIELLTAVVSVYLGHIFGIGWVLLFALSLSYALITLSLIDLDHHILPDVIVLPLLWIGLIANYHNYFTDLESAVLGAIFGYMVLWVIYQIHHRLTGKEGMGYGDFKLLAALGAWLGWQTIPVVLLLASISGTIISLLFIIFKNQSRDVQIPFGPYLAIAGFIALIWGGQILNNYLQVFRF